MGKGKGQQGRRSRSGERGTANRRRTVLQVLTDANASLAFKNKRDRKVLYVDPSRPSPGDNSTRTVIHDGDYLQVRAAARLFSTGAARPCTHACLSTRAGCRRLFMTM